MPRAGGNRARGATRNGVYMSRESLLETLKSREFVAAFVFVVGGIAAFRLLCWIICKLAGWL